MVNIVQKEDLSPQFFENNDTAKKGGIKFRLSEEQGNLLSARKDGLYFGVVAPPDVANLYVDALTGNDSNAGTRVSPLKTIQEALSRGEAGITRTISLKEKQTHFVGSGNAFDNSVNFSIIPLRGGIITFVPYGDELDAIPTPQYSGVGKYANDEYMDKQPVIAIHPKSARVIKRVIGNESQAFISTAAFAVNQDTTVHVNGVVLHASDLDLADIRSKVEALGNIDRYTIATNTSMFAIYDSIFKVRVRHSAIVGRITDVYNWSNMAFYTFKTNGGNVSLILDQVAVDDKVAIHEVNAGSVVMLNGSTPSPRSNFQTTGITFTNAKQVIVGAEANRYAVTNFTTNIHPTWLV